jgi:Icc-related predicted phosphoesterase
MILVSYSSGSLMRILLVSDLHYSLPQLDWVVRAAPSFDLVVLAGDHLDISSPVSLDAQTVVIRQYFSLIRDATHVAASSGNHDLTGPDAHGEQTALWLDEVREAGIPTDGDSLLLADTLFTICPWWDGPIGRDALQAHLASLSADRPARWVWVYHWPPLGSPTCWTGRRDYGDTELGGWIDTHRPDLVLTGHVHEPPFKPTGSWADRIGNTWIFNPGHQIGPVPTHIEIDLAAGSAVWRSLLGEEQLQIADSVPPPRTVF